MQKRSAPSSRSKSSSRSAPRLSPRLSRTPTSDTPDAVASRLLGGAEGWPLAPVIDWLFADGCRTTDAMVLTAGLCEKLIEVGAPIWRVRLAFWTIHPLLGALSHQWYRTGEQRVIEVEHTVFSSSAFIGSPAQELRERKVPLRYRLEEPLDPKRHHSALHSIKAEGGTDYYAIPMIGFNGQIAPLFLSTDKPGGFSDGDIVKFDALARFLFPVVETISQHRLSIALLDTYVGKRTAQRVLKGAIKRGDGETLDAALWFSDLRDFTLLTETLAAEDLLQLLNTYFEHVFDAVQRHGGEVLRFIGDAMLIVFPTDQEGGATQACRNALAAAEDAFAGLETVNRSRRSKGAPDIRFGVGLHLGTVVYGNVGAPTRLDFTVIGPAVNRTARLESLTKSVDRSLLYSDTFAAHIDRPSVFHGNHKVKGIAEPIAAYSTS